MTEESQQLAAQRLADRRQRVLRIRRTAIGGSLATFAAAWALIFSQLVSGHDPALAGNQQNQQAVAPVAAATASQSSGDDYAHGDGYSTPDPAPSGTSSSGTSSSGTSSSGTSSSGTLDPVTTQQS